MKLNKIFIFLVFLFCGQIIIAQKTRSLLISSNLSWFSPLPTDNSYNCLKGIGLYYSWELNRRFSLQTGFNEEFLNKIESSSDELNYAGINISSLLFGLYYSQKFNRINIKIAPDIVLSRMASNEMYKVSKSFGRWYFPGIKANIRLEYPILNNTSIFIEPSYTRYWFDYTLDQYSGEIGLIFSFK